MKSSILKAFLAAVTFMTMFSCSTARYSYRVANAEKTNVITNDVVVDVEIDLNKKVTQSSSKQKTEQLAKDEAYYKAIVNNSIDIVVDPIYETTRTGKKYVTKITGFAGYYKNARSKVSVINELEKVDTLDIVKYNYIFGTQVIRTKNSDIAILSSGKNKKNVSSIDNKKEAEVFVSNKTVKIMLGRSTGDDLGNGTVFGLSFHNQITKKGGAQIGALLSFNPVANNINVPFLFSYGGKFKILAGSNFDFTFGPKNESFSDAPIFLDFFRDELPFINPGAGLGFSFSLTKNIAIEGLSTVGLLGANPVRNNLGVAYIF